MTEWERIDTAPTNGTDVLLFRGDAGVMLGFWGSMDAVIFYEDADVSEEDYWHESWWALSIDGAYRLEGDEEPTHWMALPRPPIGE